MTDRYNKPLTPAVFHVLLALADGPLHGYAIMRDARASADLGTPMGPGTVYGSLQRLLDAGLVSASAENGEGQRKRLFSLTEEGSRALRQEARRLIGLADLLRERGLTPRTER